MMSTFLKNKYPKATCIFVFLNYNLKPNCHCSVPGAGTGARGLLACAPPKVGELCWRRLAALLSGFSQT